MAETSEAPRDCSGELRQPPFTGLNTSAEAATKTPGINAGSFIIKGRYGA
jgi:hypothetical protein